MPKIATNGVTLPRSLATVAKSSTVEDSTTSGQAVARDTRSTLNEAIQATRLSAGVIQTLRSLVSSDGTFSSAVFNFVEIAMSGYSAKAFNTSDHQFSLEGSMAAMGTIAQLSTQYDYTNGYGDRVGFEATLERALQEVVLTGAVAGELVLNKAKLADRINLVAYETIDWVSKGPGKGKHPQQRPKSGDPIPLDIPTFFVSEMHKQAGKAYADSMMTAGASAAIHFVEFVQDMRRVLKKAAIPRTTASIDTAVVQSSAPDDIKKDPEKMQAHMEAVRRSVETILSGANPEDALVVFDVVELNTLDAKGEKADFVPLLNALSGQTATALKSSPSILGLRINGSQSLSNTESLVFLKVAASVQRPVEELISRMLTLAVRLRGVDVYVEFRFDPINLRPTDELQAFKTMRTQGILELLSEGFMSDDEAGWDLVGGPRPAGAPKLSGTGFARGSKNIDVSKVSPNMDPQGRALQPDQPSNAGGSSQE